MLKIKRVQLIMLRNDEHFQFNTEFKELVEKHNPEILKVTSLFDQYSKLYDKEDEAVFVIRKSHISPKIVSADTQRDHYYRGFVDTIKAAQKHFTPDIVAAAHKIKILLNTAGNVAPMAKDMETSKLYHIVQQLKGENYHQR